MSISAFPTVDEIAASSTRLARHHPDRRVEGTNLKRNKRTSMPAGRRLSERPHWGTTAATLARHVVFDPVRELGK
jgi:hypothetical protein